jgi:short chain dehydrogenase
MTMIDINLNGVWRVCRAAMPHMINAGRGGSMTLTSSTSSYIGLPNLNHYSAAKGGVVGLMQSFSGGAGSAHDPRQHPAPNNGQDAMALNQATHDLFLPGAGLSADRVERQRWPRPSRA